MESKKVNIFALVMIVVMCAFSIFIGMRNGDGRDGYDGKSAYELALEKGLFSGTEIEYLQSLQGKDGSNVTIEDVYRAVLKDKQKTESEYPFSAFLEDYYPDTVIDSIEEQTKTERATQNALRSAVDICYSFHMDREIISCSSTKVGNNDAFRDFEKSGYISIGVSAGSGVIYQMTEDYAYIITNYHVVYVSNYTTEGYEVYYDNNTEKYFTGRFSQSSLKNGEEAVPGMFGSYISQYKYIFESDFEYAPIETHFLNTYEVYLYGYQTEEYALSATFVGGSAENDIAILKVDKNASQNNELIFDEEKGFKEAVVADSTKIAVGETAIAVGNPLLPEINETKLQAANTPEEYVSGIKSAYVDALCLTATDGVVSNISESASFQSLLDSSVIKMRLIRVSSAINSGNSGGGLFDIDGRLIGIVNSKYAVAGYDNVGYAIPINIAVSIADRVIAECSATESRIKVVTAESLGITLEESKSGIDSPYFDKESQTWINSNAVVAKTVSVLGAAGKAGLKSGDIINSIKIGTNVYELNNAYDFNDYMIKLAPVSDSVTVVFNITTNSGGVVTKDIDVVITASNFIEIV